MCSKNNKFSIISKNRIFIFPNIKKYNKEKVIETETRSFSKKHVWRSLFCQMDGNLVGVCGKFRGSFDGFIEYPKGTSLSRTGVGLS